MSQLLINLTGTINSTNFDEWRTDLIAQIQSVNQDLLTDNDFDTASRHVKSFKTAENALKNAKQSAINQAQEIQQLFASIDEITEEARQARLSLERQIRSRKSQIKEEHIQSGIEVIKAVIEEQSEDFKNGDLSHFLNRGRYESAVRGKGGIRGLEIGIKGITSIIKAEIADLSQHINNNNAKLDSLIEGYKALFQDYSQLVRWPEEQLEAEIDKRIACYESEIKQRVNENLARESKPDNIQDDSEIEPKQIGNEGFASENKPDHIQDDSEIESKQIDDEIISQKRKYRIAIQMEATPDEANRIVDNINNDFSYYITELELIQNDNLNDKPKKVHMKEDAIASCSSHTPSHSTAPKNEKSYSVDAIRKEHKNAYKEWSESDDELLKRLYSEGVGINDLSKKFGRFEGGIRSRLEKLELL